ncbi:hypothetical protein ACWGJB_48555 [Streptomyces sp. NPDC054813]
MRWLAVRKGVHTPGKPLDVAAGVRWTNLYSPLDVMPRGKGLSDLADGVKLPLGERATSVMTAVDFAEGILLGLA